jgi:hypothetical protein
MKIKYLISLIIVCYPLICNSQHTGAWDKWNWLIGEWQGEGSGIPGEGYGTFSFSFDLDRNIIIRRSHSDYTAGDFKRKTIRDDLMIVYITNDNRDRAIFFDNEGHTINYTITYTDSSIVLTSDINPHTPVFRLIYTSLNGETVYTKFQMSRDGISFMTYVEGTSKKVQEIRNSTE